MNGEPVGFTDEAVAYRWRSLSEVERERLADPATARGIQVFGLRSWSCGIYGPQPPLLQDNRRTVFGERVYRMGKKLEQDPLADSNPYCVCGHRRAVHRIEFTDGKVHAKGCTAGPVGAICRCQEFRDPPEISC